MTVKIKIIKLFSIAAILIVVGFITVCKRVSIQTVNPQESMNLKKSEWSNEPILPIPETVDLDAEKVELGEKLFNDVKLSHDNTISCASCHNLTMGGTDQLERSVGINSQVGTINAPTVFNAVYNFKQFWDGRAETLEDQIDGPTHAANEMGSSWEEIVDKLKTSPEYVADFDSLYKDGIKTENIKDAIAVFERSLITPNSRFDLFLKGNQDALTSQELEGYRIFKSVGCTSCHQGINVGGNLFQEFGVMGNYFKNRGNITEADLGRFNVTKNEVDKYVFKVPSLRNVAHTHPYFHDGSAKNLEEAVTVMSRYQLGRKLSPEEVNLIVKFLRSLNGQYKKYSKK